MRRLTRGWDAPRWAALLCGLTIVLSIGGPLVGRGVLIGADVLRTVEPWQGDTPSNFVYKHGPINDTIDFYAPERELLRSSIIHDHRIPLWNEYPNGGVPLGSLPNDGLLSPLEWPMLILGVSYGAAWMALLRLALAALCMAALCRRLGVSRLASNCAAIVYCTSGFIVAWNFWPQSDIAAWIPALFLAVDVAAEKRRLRDVLLLAVVVAAMLLEGYPPLLILTAYVLLPFAVIRVWQRPDPSDMRGPTLWPRIVGRLRAAVPIASGAVLGAGLSAFQMLPFALRLSDLNLDYRSGAEHSSLPASSLLTTVFPWAIGNPSHPSPSIDAPGFVATWTFLGAAAVVLVIVGIARGAPRNVSPAIRRWCVVTAFVIAVPLYADVIGSKVTVGGVAKQTLYRLPLLAQVPMARFSAVLLFVLTLLVALGIDRAFERTHTAQPPRQRMPTQRWTRRALWVALALVGYYQIVTLFRSEQHVLQVLHHTGWLVEHSIPALAFLVLAIVWVVAVRRGSDRTRSVATWVLPILLVAEALSATWYAYPRPPKSEYFPDQSTITFLQHNLGHDRFASADDTLFPSAGSYYGLRAVNGHSFSPQSWRELVSATSPGTVSLPTLTLLGHGLTTATSSVLDLLAAKYFVVAPDFTPYGKLVALPPATSSTTIANGRVADGSFDTGPLRAVALRVLGRTHFRGTLVELDATVRDRNGKAVASGVRRLTDQANTTTWYVPITGELLPTQSEPWKVELELRSNGADAVEVATTSSAQLALGSVRPQDDGLLLAHVDTGALVWRRLGALPRIRWASTSDEVLDSYKATLALALRKTDPNHVLLDEHVPPASGAPGSVTVLQDGSEHIRIAASAQGFGYVVVADAIQTGWTATVDGHRVPMRPADRGSVAIPVSGGHHVIELRVDPKGWKAGIAVSLLSLLIAVGLLVMAIARRGPTAGSTTRGDNAQTEYRGSESDARIVSSEQPVGLPRVRD